MGSARENFAANLERLIGDKTLKSVAHDSGVPYRTLQNALKGVIPHKSTIEKLRAYFGLESQSELLVSPTPLSSITGEQLVSALSEALKNDGFRAAIAAAWDGLRNSKRP